MVVWNPAANEIFLEAVELRSSEERNAFLDRMCGDDAETRAEVESLLSANAAAAGFLESPPELFGSEGLPRAAEERAGSEIGRYRLLEQIGEGGFGVVYRAEQREPVRRLVALKIIKPGMDTRQVIARFEAERQALAMMDHANIARVFDAGATLAGRPCFVMELVHGVPMTEYCDSHALTLRQRLDLFVPVCQAIQHAHQKGVIHRDIKPSNVLVTTQDERPVPKVIDFGIAKATGLDLTDKTLVTAHKQLIGTPAYMSPEQASHSTDIDTRSDIYSLGVLLYELLTGTMPFDTDRLLSGGLAGIQRILCEEEPHKPSTRLSELSRSAAGKRRRSNASGTGASVTSGALPDVDALISLQEIARRRGAEPVALRKRLRGDLDWIVMKCLEKDRMRRYETASGLAADVERYLKNQPVLAGPPGAAYALKKFVARHRWPVTFAAVVAVLTIAGLIGTSIGLKRATDAGARANENAAAALQKASGFGTSPPERCCTIWWGTRRSSSAPRTVRMASASPAVASTTTSASGMPYRSRRWGASAGTMITSFHWRGGPTASSSSRARAIAPSASGTRSR